MRPNKDYWILMFYVGTRKFDEHLLSLAAEDVFAGIYGDYDYGDYSSDRYCDWIDRQWKLNRVRVGGCLDSGLL